jgi:polyhydroxyalkanoate synthesis repressor PhaR
VIANPKQPVIIKKYATRRLYSTTTRTFVTLEDVAEMVRQGVALAIQDTKSGKDITRSVLLHIVLERESEANQNLLSIAFLRQLIRFYGDSMQMLVPVFLEISIKLLYQRTGEVERASSRGEGPRRARLSNVSRKKLG